MNGTERMESFPGAAAYNLVAYGASVPIVAIFIVINASLGITLLAARLSMLATFIIIVAYSIYILRNYKIKWLVLVFALFPKVLFLSSTLSADTMALAFSIIIFSILYIWADEGKIDKGRAIILIASAILLPLVKFTYIPFSLLVIPVLANQMSLWPKKNKES